MIVMAGGDHKDAGNGPLEGRTVMEIKWFDLIIATALPLAFLIQLLWSEAFLARRGVQIGGQPPIDRRLFIASKYLAIGIWLAVSLQSWGLGWQPFAGVRVPRSLSGGLWVFGFGLLFLGRINLGAHLRLGLPKEATGFHRNGAFRFTRNPMYTGIDATMIAAILYTANPAILAGGVLVMTVHHRIILVEERWLQATFGEEYERYKERVGRYVTVPCSVRSLIWAMGTLLRMGHCAPTIMSSILAVSGHKADWPVRLVAGMPGGIGYTGGECGGITSPLMLLGLLHGLGNIEGGLPLVFDRGFEHIEGFRRRCGTVLCREIGGMPPRILPCIRTIVRSTALCAGTLCRKNRGDIPHEAREAYRRLFAAFTRCGFHCARTVLRQLDRLEPARPPLLAASSAFMGGTLFAGLTCSALTAGVMALGLGRGEIERSPWRVLRMLFLMLTGGRAFDDGVNKFNWAMNRGGELAAWFAAQFGSTQCRAITGADFSSTAEVEGYLQGNGIAKCRLIAQKVSDQVQLMLEESKPALCNSQR